MKKYLHIALMLLCVFVVSSCKDDDDDTEAVEREAYKLEQDIAFQAKVNETGFVRWYSEAGDGYVCAKLIEKGNGKQAYFNSRVSVYYKGSLTDGTSLMPGCLKTVRPSSVRSVHTMRIIRTPIRMDMVPLYLVGQLLCNIWLKEINMRFGFRSS